VSRLHRPALIGAAALAALLATGCSGGPIGADTPLNSGKSFVGSSYESTVFKIGSRPQAPAVSGNTVTGGKLSLAAYHGDVVVLNFWGSWCGPCRGEAPTLAVLSEKYAKDGVSFLGDDVGDTPVNALSFTRGMGITYPSVNDPGYQVAQEFGKAVLINDTPTTLVIDRTGHIAGVIIGAATYSELDTMLQDVAVAR